MTTQDLTGQVPASEPWARIEAQLTALRAELTGYMLGQMRGGRFEPGVFPQLDDLRERVTALEEQRAKAGARGWQLALIPLGAAGGAIASALFAPLIAALGGKHP